MRVWALLCVLLGLAGLACWLAGASGLLLPAHWLWQAEGWMRMPWTLWTGALVHRLPVHALANALALAALAVLGTALGAGCRAALALALAWPLSTLALLLWPAVRSAYGLSGVIHAAAAVLTVLAAREPATRWIGLLLGAGLAFKLGLERAWTVPVAFDSGWGFNVLLAVHLTGTVCGVLCGVLTAVLPARRARTGLRLGG